MGVVGGECGVVGGECGVVGGEVIEGLCMACTCTCRRSAMNTLRGLLPS